MEYDEPIHSLPWVIIFSKFHLRFSYILCKCWINSLHCIFVMFPSLEVLTVYAKQFVLCVDGVSLQMIKPYWTVHRLSDYLGYHGPISGISSPPKRLLPPHQGVSLTGVHKTHTKLIFEGISRKWWQHIYLGTSHWQKMIGNITVPLFYDPILRQPFKTSKFSAKMRFYDCVTNMINTSF